MGGYISRVEPIYNHINNTDTDNTYTDKPYLLRVNGFQDNGNGKNSTGCKPGKELRKLSSIEMDPDDLDEVYYPSSSNSQKIKKEHKNTKVVRKAGLDHLVNTEQLCAAVKQYEIDIKNLRIGNVCFSNREYENEGSFGRIVRNGRVQSLYLTNESSCVLVKQSDPEAFCEKDQDYSWKSFLREINLLAWIGWHPNVIAFLGVVAGDVPEKELYLICEQCKNGNLRDYLRKQARKCGRIQEVVHRVEITGYYCGPPTEPIFSVKHDDELSSLIAKWALEICTAMEYLASRRVVYVELTASSIQLTENLTAKLGNFTLARSLKSDEDHFILNERIPLPWRWLPPESFEQFKYSFQTDIWAFGVFLWEILSLGQQPYTGMNWSNAFAQHLKDGLRLPRLPCITFPIYNFLKSCWDLEPGRRPNFTDAILKLSFLFDQN